MAKKAVLHLPMEIIGGVIASAAIIFVMAIVITNISASFIDNHNQKTQQTMVSALAYVTNIELSGGEHNLNTWAISGGGKNMVYAVAYIPQESARVMMEIILPGSSSIGDGSHMLTDLSDYGISDSVKQYSFVKQLGEKGLSELDKCNRNYEACMCLFKIEYKDDCLPKDDVITTDMSLDYYNTYDSGVAKDDIYEYELYRANNWVEQKLVSGLTTAAVKSAAILQCIPLKSNGCIYTNQNDIVKACIPHYTPLPNTRPVMWISSRETPFLVETVEFDVKRYDNLDIKSKFDAFGDFPRIKRMHTVTQLEKERKYLDTYYEISSDFSYVVNNDTSPVNTGNSKCMICSTAGGACP